MILSKRLAPPNSMVVLMDPSCSKFPDWENGQLVVGTEHCIFIGCLCEVDGETEFLLGDLAELHESSTVVYDGMLCTPSKRLSLSTSHAEALFEVPVNTKRTWVRIWANHPTEPNRIAIGIEAGG